MSKETYEKFKENIKDRKSGTEGKHLIHKENVRKYVLPEDIDSYISQGWELGGPRCIK